MKSVMFTILYVPVSGRTSGYFGYKYGIRPGFWPGMGKSYPVSGRMPDIQYLARYRYRISSIWPDTEYPVHPDDTATNVIIGDKRHS